jgi:hypothetical protein
VGSNRGLCSQVEADEKANGYMQIFHGSILIQVSLFDSFFLHYLLTWHIKTEIVLALLLLLTLDFKYIYTAKNLQEYV